MKWTEQAGAYVAAVLVSFSTLWLVFMLADALRGDYTARVLVTWIVVFMGVMLGRSLIADEKKRRATRRNGSGPLAGAGIMLLLLSLPAFAQTDSTIVPVINCIARTPDGFSINVSARDAQGAAVPVTGSLGQIMTGGTCIGGGARYLGDSVVCSAPFCFQGTPRDPRPCVICFFVRSELGWSPAEFASIPCVDLVADSPACDPTPLHLRSSSTTTIVTSTSSTTTLLPPPLPGSVGMNCRRNRDCRTGKCCRVRGEGRLCCTR